MRNKKKSLCELAEELWEINRPVYEFSQSDPGAYETLRDILATANFIRVMTELRKLLDEEASER